MSKDIRGIKIWYIVAVSFFAVYPLLYDIKLFGVGYIAKFYIFFAIGSIYALHANSLNRYIKKLSIPIAVFLLPLRLYMFLGVEKTLYFHLKLLIKQGIVFQ